VRCVNDSSTIILIAELYWGTGGTHILQVEIDSIRRATSNVIVPVYDDSLYDAIKRCPEDIKRLISLAATLLVDEELILLPASEVL